MEPSKGFKELLSWLNGLASIGFILINHPEIEVYELLEIVNSNEKELERLCDEFYKARAKKIEELEEAENGG